MFTHLDPHFAHANHLRAVDFQQFDCCSTDGGEADQFCCFDVPGEVFLPQLLLWMEQRYTLSGLGIYGCGVRGFVAIARGAGKAEVGKFRCASFGERHNVFNLKGGDSERFSRLAICTAISELNSYTTFQCCRNVTAHNWGSEVKWASV